MAKILPCAIVIRQAAVDSATFSKIGAIFSFIDLEDPIDAEFMSRGRGFLFLFEFEQFSDPLTNQADSVRATTPSPVDPAGDHHRVHSARRLDGTGETASSAVRMAPWGVMSNIHAKIIAIGKPTPSRTSTTVANQGGRLRGSLTTSISIYCGPAAGG